MINTKALSLSHVAVGVDGWGQALSRKQSALQLGPSQLSDSPDNLFDMYIEFFQAIPKAAL